MNINTHLPTFLNGYYLEVFPGSGIPENLINSVKTDVSTFRAKDTWFGMDVYIGMKNGVAFSKQFINSSSKEGLIHYVTFLSKLYEGQISFSSVSRRLPEKFLQNRTVTAKRQSKVFRTKSAGSIGGDDFSGSSSFISSLVSEGIRFIENENGIIKASFSFADSKGWYSELVEAFLKEQQKYGMSPEELILFEEAQKKKSLTRFLFRWKISTSGVSSGFGNYLQGALNGYSTDQNGYVVVPKSKRPFPGGRLIDSERILSHGILAPLPNPFQKIRKVPIIPIPTYAYFDGFIV